MDFENHNEEAFCEQYMAILNATNDSQQGSLPTEQTLDGPAHFNLDESLELQQDYICDYDQESLPNSLLSNNQSPREEADSSDYFENSDEPLESWIPDRKNLLVLIDHLIKHSNRSALELYSYIKQNCPIFLNREITKILIEKFKKLKKTKEQMIKYCMRKAFKFLMEMPHSQFISQSALISQEETSSRRQKNFTFCHKSKIKFLKKISAQKSMNTAYLRHIFNENGFYNDYINFISNFEMIIQEDNQRKANYLADLIIEHPSDYHKFEGLRRLPWTDQLLDKVKKLSHELIKFAGEE